MVLYHKTPEHGPHTVSPYLPQGEKYSLANILFVMVNIQYQILNKLPVSYIYYVPTGYTNKKNPN